MVKVFSILFMLVAFPGLSYVLAEQTDALINTFTTSNDDDSDESDGANQLSNMRKHCSGFEDASARVMEAYNYSSNLTEKFPDLNFAHGQAEAFTLVIMFRVMNSSELFFDIADFPRAYFIKFPPKLPIMCYHAWRAIAKNKWKFNTKSLLSVFDRQTYIDAQVQHAKDSKENETLKTDTHKKRFESYMTQRKTLVHSMKTLETESTDSASKKRALLNSCSEVANITSFDIGKNAEEVLSWLSPNFDRERFNAMVKMFIGDVIMYEILEQACRATSASLPAQAKHLDWENAHKLLVAAEQYLKANWNNTQIGQLETDVRSHINSSLNTNQANDKGEFYQGLTTYLNNKYHWLAFRVHYYLNSKFEDIGACKSANMRCVKEKGLLIVVRWKDIYSDNITIDAVRESAIANITEIVRSEKTYPDDKAKAEKVVGVVNAGLDGMFAGLHKLTKVKEGLSVDASGKLLKVSTEALVKVSKSLKTALKVLSTVGKFLGPFVGSLCAVLSMFEEDGTSAILSKIDEGFNAMHGRFDKIEQGLADLRKHLEEQIEEKTAFHGAFTTYQREVISPLRKLRDAFQTVGALSQDPFTDKRKQKEQMQLMREACSDKSINPVTIMSAMYDQMTCTRDRTFCNTVVAWAKDSRAKLQGMLLSRATELATLLAYNTKCAAYKSGWNTITKIEYETSVVLEQADEIQRTLSRLENDQLYEWQSTLLITLKEYQNKLSADVSSAATEIANALENKYNWNDFLVIAFSSPYEKYNTHPVDGETQYNFMKHFIYNDDNAYVFTHTDAAHPDTVFYAIVMWGLMNETDSSDYTMRWASNIEGRWNGRTILCGSSFKKVVKNTIANGEDVKSMFIFRRYAGHFWHEKHSDGLSEAVYPYDPDANLKEAPDTGFAKGGSLKGRVRGMDCWHKINSYDWDKHKDHRIIMHFIANVGGGY